MPKMRLILNNICKIATYQSKVKQVMFVTRCPNPQPTHPVSDGMGDTRTTI